jgi:hypothetical protein
MRAKKILVVGMKLAAWLVFFSWASAQPRAPQPLAVAKSASPAADCSIVSCTAYLPMVIKSPLSIPANFEVTQAVQQPNNSVILAANRTTYVRFTLTSAQANSNVSAYLYGTDNSDQSLPGSPIAALNNPRTLKTTANRATLNDTFNFKLPAAWTTGSIKISAQASNTAGYEVNTLAAPFQFAAANPMNVTIIPIRYNCTNHNTFYKPAAPYNYLTDYTYRIYPVPSISTSTHSTANYSGPCSGTGPTPAPSDWENILDREYSVIH